MKKRRAKISIRKCHKGDLACQREPTPGSLRNARALARPSRSRIRFRVLSRHAPTLRVAADSIASRIPPGLKPMLHCITKSTRKCLKQSFENHRKIGRCASKFSPGGLLEASWARLGASWARLDASWRAFAVLARLGASWEKKWEGLGSSWARLGSVLGASWARLGACWARLGAAWVRLGWLLERPGWLWGRLWDVLGELLRYLVRSWPTVRKYIEKMQDIATQSKQLTCANPIIPQIKTHSVKKGQDKIHHGVD